MSAFNESWVFLKELVAPSDDDEYYDEEKVVARGGAIAFDELLDNYTKNYPYFTHPENETYKELMQYIQQIENQKTPLTEAQDEDRRFLARLAVEEGDHLHELEEGR